MSSDTLNEIGPKKRRRSRKRSRKSKVKKTCEVGTHSDGTELHDSSAEVLAEIELAKSENMTSGQEDGEEKCGCQIEQGLGRKRRRRSRRRIKKLGLVGILPCEAVDYYTSDEYFNSQELEFVVPAFTVHQRCEHPMYMPKSVLTETNTPIPEVLESVVEDIDTKNVCESGDPTSKRSNILEKQDGLDEHFATVNDPVLSPDSTSDPVVSVDDVTSGDIIYFDQLTLRESEPVIERRKAKVFLVMKSPDTNNGSSVLLRTYVGYDNLNPATWHSKEDPLSEEPLIIKFQDLHGVRKVRSTV